MQASMTIAYWNIECKLKKFFWIAIWKLTTLCLCTLTHMWKSQRQSLIMVWQHLVQHFAALPHISIDFCHAMNRYLGISQTHCTSMFPLECLSKHYSIGISGNLGILAISDTYMDVQSDLFPELLILQVVQMDNIMLNQRCREEDCSVQFFFKKYYLTGWAYARSGN